MSDSAEAGVVAADAVGGRFAGDAAVSAARFRGVSGVRSPTAAGVGRLSRDVAIVAVAVASAAAVAAGALVAADGASVANATGRTCLSNLSPEGGRVGRSQKGERNRECA
jgi:hypothetical protein